MSSLYLRLVRQARRDIIKGALLASGGNRSLAAESLGMQRTYLVHLVRDLGIDIAASGHGRPPKRSA